VLSQAYCGFRAGVFQGVGSACATAGCTLAWIEQGDAGDLPATAQAVTGSGPIPGITGTLRDIMDADMFQIRICDAAAFSADTVNAGMTFDDTQLFLFDNAGRGVVFDDDDPQLIGYHSHISAQLVPGNGLYYLAISSWDEDPVGALTGQPIWEDAPYNLERPPDGPAAAEAIGGWDGGGDYAGQYLITLTGVCSVGPAPCYANCDGSTTAPILNVSDFACFLNRFAAGESYANCDASTTPPVLNIGDFACFLNAFAAGCP
jgi:hypothetical protein